MILCHVRNLVTDHTRQLGLALRRKNSARVHTDTATEDRKGIDRVVADGEKIEIASRIRTGFDEATPEAVKIVIDFRVVDVAWLAQTNLVHDVLANSAFDLRRQFGARRLSEVRKIISHNERRSCNQ